MEMYLDKMVFRKFHVIICTHAANGAPLARGQKNGAAAAKNREIGLAAG
jgi:hypothetical protein